MRIVKLEKKNFGIIIDYLQKGKVVVASTETAYGLLANALDERAVWQVFKIKKRRTDKELSVFVGSIKAAKEYVRVDERVEKIANKFLPGPLTLVLRAKKEMPFIKDKLAIRISSHSLIKYLTANISFPLTATSANIAGGESCYSVREVLRQFDNQEFQPDLILDGGELKRGKISTVIDLTEDKVKCLREGEIELKEIDRIMTNDEIRMAK